MGFPASSDGKEFACHSEDQVQSLGWEDPLEKGMVTHSSILAWTIPWPEEPGGLQSKDHEVPQPLVANTHTQLRSASLVLHFFCCFQAKKGLFYLKIRKISTFEGFFFT